MGVDDYVVLKITGVEEVDRGELLGGTAEIPDESELTIEKRTLEPSELGQVRSERGFVGMAPRIPVALVAPVADSETEISGSAVAQGATWGLEAVGALTSPFDGSGVTVAVLDTGIDANHEAFQAANIVQQDFTGEGNGDGNGHGTHCAGTVFGGEVGGIRIGVAPKIAKALIGKVLDGQGRGSTEQILDGVLWAARNGANVISMSIGFDFPGYVRILTSQGLDLEPATSRALSAYRQNLRLFDNLAALVQAHSAMFANTLIVAAAGNESRRPRYEIDTAPPAEAVGILAVGALGQTNSTITNLKIANFSNAGPDVAAPGVNVSSAKPGGGVQSLNGTSMATPHVAGVAALWFQKLQDENPGFLMSQLEGSVVGFAIRDVLATPDDRADAGAGLVRAPQP
jgi:subtilisin family serine protease